MKRFLWLGFVLSCYLICTGCGDTFRPIIIPNPPTFPNPAASHTVVAINDNFGCIDQLCDNGFALLTGSAMSIDVSGDSISSVADCTGALCLGIAPVHAVQQTASQVLVVNQAVTAAGTGNAPATGCVVTVPPSPPNQVFNVCSSVTKVDFNGASISGTTTLTLPPYAGASFVAVAPNDTLAYVTMPTYPPDPTQPTVIVPSVEVVNTQSNNVVATIPVGSNPVALAVTPDKSKLYVANQGDGTISGFNTKDRSQRTITPATTNKAPIWLIARSDNQRVYVLEETTGALASIDTSSTAGPDPLTEYPSISVPGATMMVYDSNLNRLYIPGGKQLAIVDVSQSTPQLLATLAIPQVPGVPAVDAFAVAVAALPDGSRAYIASVPSAAQSSEIGISGVQGDGTTATYAYRLTGGHDLTTGISVTVSGLPSAEDGFNGTYVVESVSNSVAGTTCDQPTSNCTFQAANANTVAQAPVTGVASSTVNNLFPQVSVVNVSSNSITTTFGIPGFPDATVPGSPNYAPICGTTRFRFMMAAGGDSKRAYLSSCDGGNVNFIDTTTNTYFQNLPAPAGSLPNNPPQNPVFLIAGP